MKYKNLINLNQKFNKSTNILIDKYECNEFIKTTSLNEVIQKIEDSISLNSLSLIGPFGSGKSTILLYLENYFSKKCSSNKNYLVIKILGEYNSFVNTLNREFSKIISIKNTILETLKELDKFSKKKYDGFVILIDELGKFIDYSSENLNSDIYELQNLAEFVNKSDNYLFVTIHKSFSGYKLPFSEWDKIQGRFENILIRDDYSEVIKILKNIIKLDETSSKKLIKQIVNKFNLDKTFIELSPLHPFSVIALSEIFNKYFQNQRTLFSFLFSYEKYAFREFLENTPPKLYNLANLFDYVNYLLKVYNILIPDKEVYYLVNVRLNSLNEIEQKILKTIGLIHSFKLSNLKSDEEGIIYSLIDEYEEEKIKNALKNLKQNSIIIFQESSSSYAVIENSNININKELEKRLKNNFDYKKVLEKYFLPLEAKKYFVEYGNKILFRESFLVDEFSVIYSTNELKIPDNSVLVTYENEKYIKELANKVAAIESIKEDNKILSADTLDILNEMLDNTILILKQTFNHSLKTIIYKNNSFEYSYKKLQQILSDIAYNYASFAPIINNYTLTHTKNTTAMLKKLFIAMLNNSDKKDLGIQKYPAEKTLYLSVIKPAGFHRIIIDGKYQLTPPNNLNFDKVFEEIQNIFSNRNSIILFLERMKESPFMINEFISLFTLNLFLIVYKNRINLYRENRIIFNLNEDILIDIIKQPKKYEVEFVTLNEKELEIFKAYLSILNEETNDYDIQKVSKFITAIYSRFKKLPFYSLHTNNLSIKAKKLRSVLLSIRDIKKGFFKEIVEVLEFKNQTQFSNNFKQYFNEIVLSFDKLQSELKEFIDKEFYLVDKDIQKYESQNRLIIKNIINNDLSNLSFLLMKKDIKEFYDKDVEEFKKILKEKANDLLNISNINFDNAKKIVIYSKDSKIEKIVHIKNKEKLKSKIEKFKKEFSEDEVIYILSEILKENNETN